MAKRDFIIVGIGNHIIPQLTTEVMELICKIKVFSGGKRHYTLVKHLLPKKHTWIQISGRMDVVLHEYSLHKKTILIFASGDPFFYGFGNTLKAFLPEASIQSFPYFNSVQRLCHKSMTNYSELHTVSVHGRPWAPLDVALIKDEPLIGILTDGKKTPAVIAKRMIQYGFSNYRMIVGEELDGELEQITNYELEACADQEHLALNCILLVRKHPKNTSFGLPDDQFVPLPNRSKMITKLPIRHSTIHALDLRNAISFWDVGACTGSVAIEAKRHYPHLSITAFEIRSECRAIIQENKERFSTPGIEVVIADFFDLDIKNYPMPNVVFIGGHGNRLEEMILKIHALNPTVRFVTNAVKDTSSETFINTLTTLNYRIKTTNIQVDEYNKIAIHTAVNN
ncbi:MAG: precorrin-6y C5,15-methyltransferase (decarboxylating) subunit CbiE [Flavobacteriaceae bacterium]|nr:MAG: precorrin-6y C5,15-methyltransferase (decarboxylating) subunit CbiE [Flavobacteriaceae bacterium]